VTGISPADVPLEALRPDILSPLGFLEMFPDIRPIEIDLGSGSGKFLLEAAQRFPDRHFLGVERLLGRIRKTQQSTVRLGLTNLRLLRLEINYTVRYLIPPNSISKFHLYFPDPWPKRRHQARRLVNPEFFAAIATALVADGEFRIKTDHASYFEQICRVANWSGSLFASREWSDEGYPASDFEEDFLSRGLSIYRLRLVKVS
jgi:tRNA (guanine-N7-)-methyltransferase